MTDTQIGAGTNDGDAIVFGQDIGTGIPQNNDSNSAAGVQLMNKYKGDGTYVGEDENGNPTLQFNDVDTTNEAVDIGTGYAYIAESGHSAQSGGQETFDTNIPVSTPYTVILPSEVTSLGLGTDTDNDLWLAIDPTANDSVYIRHGSGLSAPTDPSVKLGTVNSSDGSTTRPNDLASATLQSLSTEEASIGKGASPGTTQVASVHPLEGNSQALQLRQQRANNIGSTATKILNVDSLNDFNPVVGGRAVVIGRDNVDSATMFSDIIAFTRAGEVTVGPSSDRGSTDSRSYSIDASSLDVSFAADDYDVSVSALGHSFF